jgi:hypothetical protein
MIAKAAIRAPRATPATRAPALTTIEPEPSQFSLGTAATAPWLVYSVRLPEVYQGIRLGGQVNGKPSA